MYGAAILQGFADKRARKAQYDDVYVVEDDDASTTGI